MLSIKSSPRRRPLMFKLLRRETRDHEQLSKDLRRAATNGELRLVYQAIVDARSEETVAVEALCRWRHPTRGDIGPNVFIPLAEETGTIAALGEFVLRQACLDARSWPNVILSVNVSPKQFESPHFADKIRRTLLETGLPPTRLELELTENLLIADFDHAAEKMRALQDVGVRLALDDFGAGYSSLNYLLSLPFDKLKIDRLFVSKIDTGAASAAIIHAIVSIGRALGMHVTAEGVETAEQQQFLKVAGVHSFQGFRFCVPVAAVEISERLAAEDQARADALRQRARA
ncbi:EAL domain-containing protein [Methylocystis parvus]|uniref:EAL domain-containing protein n=2 Tax=Methylocystis parvus TaxID=134 RepID=A0A6B8M2U8_9HYPH|nr:EAL domain-containing protein [Methylocystis parvus]